MTGAARLSPIALLVAPSALLFILISVLPFGVMTEFCTAGGVPLNET